MTTAFINLDIQLLIIKVLNTLNHCTMKVTPIHIQKHLTNTDASVNAIKESLDIVQQVQESRDGYRVCLL